jgi:hypothetical protein
MNSITLTQPLPTLIRLGVVSLVVQDGSAPEEWLGQRIEIESAPGEESNDNPIAGVDCGSWWWRWAVDLGIIHDQATGREAPAPLGVSVCTALLETCLPIIEADDEVPIAWMPHVAPYSNKGLHIWHGEDDYAATPGWRITSLADQSPYQQFTPGAFVYVLSDVKGTEQ